MVKTLRYPSLFPEHKFVHVELLSQRVRKTRWVKIKIAGKTSQPPQVCVLLPEEEAAEKQRLKNSWPKVKNN
jgi:hypothetical protein